MGANLKRRNYFIKKTFQLKFIGVLLTLIISGSLILGWVIYRMANQALAQTFYRSHLQIKSTWEILFPAVTVATGLAIFITGTITIAMVLIFSHRIAGPLFRVEKNMEEVAKGDLTVKTKLRDSDELEMLARTLNLLTERLNKQMKEIKTGIRKLSECLQEPNCLKDDSKSKEIKDNLGHLNKIISRFKL